MIGIVLELALRATWWTISTTGSTVYYYAFTRPLQQKMIRKKEEREEALQKQVQELQAEVKELKQNFKK